MHQKLDKASHIDDIFPFNDLRIHIISKINNIKIKKKKNEDYIEIRAHG